MDSFIKLCDNRGNAHKFPSNLTHSNKFEQCLTTYNVQIRQDEKRLFSEQCREGLTFWDYSSNAQGNTPRISGYSRNLNPFMLTMAFSLRAEICQNDRSIESLSWRISAQGGAPSKMQISVGRPAKVYVFGVESKYRHRFVHAVGGNSRDCLDTTLEMLLLAFSFFRVMPEFLDFLFLFGYQAQAEDLYFSSFGQKTSLIPRDQGLIVPKFLWSGFELQICYSLKSVERSVGQAQWPWSIRQCAIHHTFDVEFGRADWIIIKGNKEIARRIRSATGSHGSDVYSSLESPITAFNAALYIHLIICEWSTGNWRWYIKFLEQELERLTQGAVTTNADVGISPVTGNEGMVSLHRIDTQKTQQSQKNRAFPFPKTFSRAATQTTDNMLQASHTDKSPTTMYTNPSGKKQPLPPGMTIPTMNTAKKPIRPDTWGQQIFAFSDLQDIQDLEEKANETVLVMRLNLNVMQQLGDHYTSILRSQESLRPFKENCSYDMECFRRRIHEIDCDIKLQILRVDALLRKLSDRRTLVSTLRTSCCIILRTR